MQTRAPFLRGEIENIDEMAPLAAKDRGGMPLPERRWPDKTPFAAVLDDLLALASDCAGHEGLAAIGRRIVHGLSYEYIARHLVQAAPELAQGRVIVAHLGSGASLCALQGGRSIATTMGFNVLDGLVMGTRCGAVDPGVILYLARKGHSLADIEDMLYHRSGLLGVSGVSGDMRVLLTSEAPDARAAIKLFTYRVATGVGALTSALGGLDGLVFTAGTDEHSPAVRTAICARLGWLGASLDETANAVSADAIGVAGSAIDIRVVAADEEAMTAHHTRVILSAHTCMVEAAHG